nr:hypothetical protein [uncultured Pedobacter sp.]
MTLSFQQQIDGKPNYFIEKIWEGFLQAGISEEIYHQYQMDHAEKLGQMWGFPDERLQSPKLHSIRKGNRWKAGDKIHFVINNRTKNRFQFAPIVPVVSTQEFEIKWVENPKYKERYKPEIYIDGKLFFSDYFTSERKELERLSQNDGFEEGYDVCYYFNKNFKGQIIHWTDLKY